MGMEDDLSLRSVKGIAILDNDGARILAKYYDDTFPTIKEQKAFEKNLFNKTCKANGEIILLDGLTCLYRSNVDLYFYVMGGAHENEIWTCILLKKVQLMAEKGETEQTTKSSKGAMKKPPLYQGRYPITSKRRASVDETPDQDGSPPDLEPEPQTSSQVAYEDTGADAHQTTHEDQEEQPPQIINEQPDQYQYVESEETTMVHSVNEVEYQMMVDAGEVGQYGEVEVPQQQAVLDVEGIQPSTGSAGQVVWVDDQGNEIILEIENEQQLQEIIQSQAEADDGAAGTIWVQQEDGQQFALTDIQQQLYFQPEPEVQPMAMAKPDSPRPVGRPKSGRGQGGAGHRGKIIKPKYYNKREMTATYKYIDPGEDEFIYGPPDEAGERPIIGRYIRPNGDGVFNPYVVVSHPDRPGLVYKFLGRPHHRNPNNLQWSCAKCMEAKRQNRDSLKDHVPATFSIKNGILLGNPQYPRHPHFCEPIKESRILYRMEMDEFAQKSVQIGDHDAALNAYKQLYETGLIEKYGQKLGEEIQRLMPRPVANKMGLNISRHLTAGRKKGILPDVRSSRLRNLNVLTHYDSATKRMQYLGSGDDQENNIFNDFKSKFSGKGQLGTASNDDSQNIATDTGDFHLQDQPQTSGIQQSDPSGGNSNRADLDRQVEELEMITMPELERKKLEAEVAMLRVLKKRIRLDIDCMKMKKDNRRLRLGLTTNIV